MWPGKDKWVHSICFIRDNVKFCLGLSLNFLGNLPSPVPYSSLIFQANLDRLSLYISYWNEVCMKQKTMECANFWHELWMKQSAVNQSLFLNICSSFCLQYLKSCLLTFPVSLGLSLIFFKNLPTVSYRPSLIKQTECITQRSSHSRTYVARLMFWKFS